MGAMILPATFDAVRRGINPGSLCAAVLCTMSRNDDLVWGLHDASMMPTSTSVLMEAGFDGVLAGFALSVWSKKGAGCNDTDAGMGDMHKKKTYKCQISPLLLLIRATCPIVPNQRAMTLKLR